MRAFYASIAKGLSLNFRLAECAKYCCFEIMNPPLTPLIAPVTIPLLMPKTTRQSLGQRGEQLAADQLTTLGYSIMDRNFYCGVGEIDIVARRSDLWIFVEVRTRRGRKYGTPEESITPRKRAHLIAAAQTYLQAKEIGDVDWQIALVAVEFGPAGQLLRVDVIENAINEQ